MKINRNQLLLALFIIVLLFLLSELIWRHKVVTQSLAEQLYKLKQYKQTESILQRNNAKSDSISAANLAKCQYKQDKYKEAEASSEAALQKAKHNGALSYDRGNIAYKQGDYETALKHYRDAILHMPQDTDAKANYELALRKKLQQPPPPPQPKEDKEQDKKKEEEIRNILGGLDNKESSDRKQQPKGQNVPKGKWW
ncbi:MAG: tetratricopeptide repeat protein [Candidatus Cloacimonas sp.]|jgi:Ca-activated chloride channel family protein|nr:tetratricopeptide repeat protein [Candidatus Cloacimonas sp.]